ncbi:hypothetical protein KEM60_03049 [Austwickia sp. TVS 96-490-7B]|uniref:hypothetical protein n=1 Tax=Austwickia sp. TVS 96-490-7B TaxID=2830843 RepID=UPI001C5A3882|nr:hypothetical protein [Austwickia sp. TVS 96-490-7B]MBW3086820.1 hypothetical protein [Austwickia sp. TVS 96-490-7B]
MESADHRPDVALGQRLAERMMAGHGTADLHIFQGSRCHPLHSITHARSGRHLAMVSTAADLPASMVIGADDTTDIRIHLHRQADVPDARIALADIHGAGQARVVTPDEAFAIAEHVGGIFATTAMRPHHVVIDVLIDVAILQGPLGTQCVNLTHEPSWTPPWTTLEAYDQALSLGEWYLGHLADAVIDETLPGFHQPVWVCSEHDHPLEGRIFPVDIDAWGALLLDLRNDPPQNVYLPFGTPATTLEEVADNLDEMFDQTQPVARWSR